MTRKNTDELKTQIYQTIEQLKAKNDAGNFETHPKVDELPDELVNGIVGLFATLDAASKNQLISTKERQKLVDYLRLEVSSLKVDRYWEQDKRVKSIPFSDGLVDICAAPTVQSVRLGFRRK